MQRPSVQFVDTPNRSRGLMDPPEGIVIHGTMGGYAGSIRVLQTPSHQASCHLIAAQDGRRALLTPTPRDMGPQDGRYKAWHCIDGNAHFLGIEHEVGIRQQGIIFPDEWTDAMLRSSAEVAAWWCVFYGIPVMGPIGAYGQRLWFKGLDGHDNVPGNNHMDPLTDFPWVKYIGLMQSFIHAGKESTVGQTFAPPLPLADIAWVGPAWVDGSVPGFRQLGVDGGVYNWLGAPDHGSPFGKPYWAGHIASFLAYDHDSNGKPVPPGFYVVVDTMGSRYGPAF